MPRVVTIGVYGSTLEAFLDELRKAEVKVLLDLRQRRGVRGPQYAWANAARLVAALEEAGIEYQHHKELAPTTELRQAQYREDDRLGEGKRSRTHLAPVYAEGYTQQILDKVDLGPIVDAMPDDGATALFCVERDAEACHRSIVAARMAERYGVDVTHLRAAPAD